MAFSSTHWNNAVEAEVYGPAMFMIFSLVWLALRWVDRREKPFGNRYLVAISYVALLSLGIHMTVYLALPAIFLFIVLADAGFRRDWRFWVTGVILFLVTVDLMMFLIGAGLWLILSLVLAAANKATGRWGLIAAIMVAGWLGYTSQLFLPIRSAHDPWIDENNPESFESFRGFLERKQYGQTSMVKRMFTRRGTWANQFGDHAHMGFYRYFKQQYGFDGWPMVPVILVGFFGAFWLLRRAGPWGVLIWALFLLGSVGLVLYMNFADGTQYYRLRPDAYMEVRNRDYFFTPGFTLFGMMLGLGLAALAARIGEKSAGARKAAVAVAVIAALIPIHTLADNWRGADRSRNYTPYDYAWNILQSCEPNGILFSSGDNDTFPLWCIQETYRVRKDVTTVNLSLANTDWYVYQMKNNWGLPLSFTDDQILWTVPDMSTGGVLKRPKDPYDDPISGTRHYLFQTRAGDEIVSVNKMVVEDLILNNKWERPVYFTSHPGSKSRLGLSDHTRVVGQVYQAVKEVARGEMDYERTEYLMDSVFLFRSYSDPTIGLDDNAAGLAIAFPERMLALADHYRAEGDTVKWGYWARKAANTFPYYYRGYEGLATYHFLTGDSTAADSVLLVGVDAIEPFVREMPYTRLYWYFWGKMQELVGLDDEAEASLARSFYLNPYEGVLYQEYVGFLSRRGKVVEAGRAASKWLEYYPSDQQARALVSAAARAATTQRPPPEPTDDSAN
jgi:hypothetical protein